MKPVETARLVLRPFRLEDAEEAHRVLDVHPEVWRFDPGFERTLEQRRQILVNRIREYDTSFGRAGIGMRAVILRETRQLVGYAGLQVYFNSAPLLPEDGPYATCEVEYYYKLGRDFWGAGYATEAGRAVLDLAFRQIRLRRIATVTDRENERSIRLLTRLGASVTDSPDESRLVVGVIVNPYI